MNLSTLFRAAPIFSAVATVAILWPTSYASASGITSADPIFEVIPAPTSVLLGGLESNTRFRIFRERTNVTASDPLRINVTPTGGVQRTDSFSDYNDSFLPVGTRFDSYFFNFDPVGDQFTVPGAASITFDQPILGDYWA